MANVTTVNVSQLGPVQGSLASPAACVGTTQVGALAIVSSNAVILAAAGQTAASLPAGAPTGMRVTVLNAASTATSATVFPATAAGKINNGSAGASVSIAQNKAALFVNIDGADNWTAVLSA
jgi:hypothetical protein